MSKKIWVLVIGILVMIIGLIIPRTIGTTECCDQLSGKGIGFPIAFKGNVSGGIAGVMNEPFFNFSSLALNVLFWAILIIIALLIIRWIGKKKISKEKIQ